MKSKAQKRHPLELTPKICVPSSLNKNLNDSNAYIHIWSVLEQNTNGGTIIKNIPIQ